MSSSRRINEPRPLEVEPSTAGATSRRDLEALARYAIANCLADVETFPTDEDYAIADDVLLALANAGIGITRREE